MNELESMLVRRLSVFAGGWTLPAAVQVCGGQGIEPSDVPDLLSSLVEKSLVVLAEGKWKGRYRLLEGARRNIREKPLERREGEALRDRHLDYFLAFAEEAEIWCRGPEQLEWLDRIEADLDNLRAALEWSAHGRDESCARLAAAAARFWEIRGHYQEGLKWLEPALVRNGTLPRVRARALEAAVSLASIWRRTEETVPRQTVAEWQEEALELYRQAGDTAGVARSLANLSRLVNSYSECERAKSLASESLALAREQNDRFTLAHVLSTAPWIEYRHGDRELALALWEEAVALYRELGCPHDLARQACSLGTLYNHGRQSNRARPLLEEALAHGREFGDQWLIAVTQDHLADLDTRAGDEESAIVRGEESVRVWREMGDHRRLAWQLPQLAQALLGQGAADRARQVLQEAAALPLEPRIVMPIARCQVLLSGLSERQGDREAARAHEAEALRLALTLPAGERWGCLALTGHAARGVGDYSRALRFYDESLEVSGRLGFLAVPAQSLEDYGVLAAMQGQYERAVRLLGAAEAQAEAEAARRSEQAPQSLKPPIEHFMNADDYPRAVAICQAALGEDAFTSGWHTAGRAMSFDEAIDYALDGRRMVPRGWRLAQRLKADMETDRAAYQGTWKDMPLSEMSRRLSRTKQSLALHDLQHNCLAEQLGNRGRAPEQEAEVLRSALDLPESERLRFLGTLGDAARDVGRYDKARTFYNESLELRRKSGDLQLLARSLEDLGVLAAMEGAYVRAARLLGAAEAAAQGLDRTSPGAIAEDYHRAAAVIQAALGQEAFAVGWQAGRAMALEQAVEYALRDSPEDDTSPDR